MDEFNGIYENNEAPFPSIEIECSELGLLASKHPDLEVCMPEIHKAYNLLADTFHRGGKLLLCGNGGSAADCEHIVGELMKGFLSRRTLPDELRTRLKKAYPEDGDYLADRLQGALPAISLVSHVSLSTAFANDVAHDLVFAQQVLGYGRPGDSLLGISTSGSSKNVLYALQVARMIGLHTIGFTGLNGHAMDTLCEAVIHIPWERTSEIQERHMAVYHAICAELEKEFFG